MDNVRTMKFIGEDFWSRPVYKCVETKQLWKDVNCGDGEPSLYSCSNDFDGEPDCPIRPNLELYFIGRDNEPTSEEKFNYQMLSRLQMDCEYYLGNGNRNEKRLWAGNVGEQITKMKELHNSFDDDKKPEWLTYEQILEYEKLMVESA